MLSNTRVRARSRPLSVRPFLLPSPGSSFARALSCCESSSAARIVIAFRASDRITAAHPPSASPPRNHVLQHILLKNRHRRFAAPRKRRTFAAMAAGGGRAAASRRKLFRQAKSLCSSGRGTPKGNYRKDFPELFRAKVWLLPEKSVLLHSLNGTGAHAPLLTATIFERIT